MRSYDVVGYSYQADLWCPFCAEQAMIAAHGDKVAPPALYPDTVEGWAPIAGIPCHDDGTPDEHLYDSGDFPKVVLCDQADADDRCCDCHEYLIES